MSPEQEQKVLASLYDRLYDAVSYAPDGKSSAFPKNAYFQMTKNTVLDPADFADMSSPVNPNGDQRSAEFFSGFVDALPKPGALWSDSGSRLSGVVSTVLANANTASTPDAAQQKIYQAAYAFLNTKTQTKDFLGNTADKIDPSAIAIAYDDAQAAYIAAVCGYRTAYNGYDLDKKEDQRGWNAAAPTLQNLVNATWNAWVRNGKAQVEQAQAALASTVNDAVRYAIQEQQALCSAQYQLPSATGAGTWLPSYAVPANWAAKDAKGIKLSFSSEYLNKTESTSSHTYGVEARGSYGLFHASGGVQGSHDETHSHMDAENFTLEAELMAVNIMRPWFNPLLFGMGGWWVNGYKKGGLSDGQSANPSGQVPLIPTGMVVARNVSVAADFSSKDRDFVSNAVNTTVSAGWGPFSLSGSYGYKSSDEKYQSRFDGGKLVFPGLQVVAWINTVTPASPPLDAK